MTIKSKLTVLSLMVAVLATSFATVSAYADEGEELEKPPVNEQRQLVQEALENGDYDTVAGIYLEHTGSDLTESQFQVMQEAHGLMQQAKTMLEEAGIEMPRMKKLQNMKNMKAKFLENLSEEQQEALEQARELKQAGDLEGAKEILEEAEIPFPQKGRFHKNYQE